MTKKFISAFFGVLLLCFSGFGLFLTFTSRMPSSSGLPETALFGGFALTAALWIYLSFRPSKAGMWLLYACGVGAIGLNAFAGLATRDDQGLSGVSLEEWVRMALGTVILGVLLGLAARARKAKHVS